MSPNTDERFWLEIHDRLPEHLRARIDRTVEYIRKILSATGELAAPADDRAGILRAAVTQYVICCNPELSKELKKQHAEDNR